MIKELNISTERKEQFIDITKEVQKAISDTKEGICVVFTPHTTAAITINENADPDVDHDIVMKLKKIASDNSFRHSEGNSDAHVKSSLVGASETVIIKDSKLILGTWQGVKFCEFDGPRQRKILIKIIKE